VNIKGFRSLLERGLIAEFGPEIIKGYLVELFQSRHIGVKEATEWIEQNKSIWNSLKPEQQAQLNKVSGKLGNINYINADWAIDAFRKDLPALASLFLGWKKAHNWLERQLDEIKKHILA